MNPVCPPPATSRGRAPARTWKKNAAPRAQNSPRFSAWGPRLYTFFLYLSAVEDGGETRFTRLNISVTPRKVGGRVAVGLSDDPFKTDERTYHEAVTVRKGTKYSANFWIHMYEFQQALGPRVRQPGLLATPRPTCFGTARFPIIPRIRQNRCLGHCGS